MTYCICHQKNVDIRKSGVNPPKSMPTIMTQNAAFYWKPANKLKKQKTEKNKTKSKPKKQNNPEKTKKQKKHALKLHGAPGNPSGAGPWASGHMGKSAVVTRKYLYKTSDLLMVMVEY